MPKTINRRGFIKQSACAALAMSAKPSKQLGAQTGTVGPRLAKALLYEMLPKQMSVADKFKLAADLGFQGVEVTTTSDDKTVEKMRSAADQAGVRIHSVMNKDSWNYPLSSGDSATVTKGLDLLRLSLVNAKALGADTVLLVPAVVTPEVRYMDAWQRSQREIRKLLPLARQLGITIAIENVGNRFLLSPLEFAKYIDEFDDPFLQAYFDIGNCLMLWGYPQDWILTLGSRIKKIHLKDCDFGKKRFVLLGDGQVDWPAVRRTIDQIQFNGFMTVEPNYRTPELDRGDRAYLEKIADRIDSIIGGKSEQHRKK